MHLHAGIVLGFVVELVGHGGLVVADALAHGDGDLLATRLRGCGGFPPLTAPPEYREALQ